MERSAALCAVWRWKETTMKSPLVQDSYAHDMAQDGLGSEMVAKLAKATFASSLQYLVALRTRLLDDYLAACFEVRNPPIRQVVQLAVGCDTRALRLASSPFVRYFEVDTPRVAGFRHRL
eukprot:symbB.v1.2.007618.t1/scaffold467.1/size200107/13